ncbi:MAG: LysR family transcriptional regulator [Thomasclavelia ramosa]
MFIRGSRQITLTNSGIILKRRAKEMLDLQDKTAAEIRKSEYDISGEITIGCGESSGNKLLPVVLKEFSKRYPKLNIIFIRLVVIKIRKRSTRV